MKPILAAAAGLALALAAVPAPTQAQVTAELGIRLGLPIRPALVVVQPGVQVVPDYEDEVFFTAGAYWLRRGPTWYRAPRPTVAFVPVAVARVPVALVRLPPPGHYKRYKHVPPGHAKRHGEGRGHEKGHGKGHGKH